MHCKICILYDLKKFVRENDFFYQHSSLPKEEDLFLGLV